MSNLVGTRSRSPLGTDGLWFSVTMLLVYWLTTYGTFQLFGEEMRSVAFDSLARNLLGGAANVDPESINWEGFDYQGKRFMYFGLFPALPRVPVLALFPELYGLLARPALLVASAWIWLSVLRWSRAVLKRRQGMNELTALWPGMIATAFTLGTPVIHLASCGRIYNEVILWALAGSLAAVYQLDRILRGEQTAVLARLELVIGIAVALLARITFALPLLGFIGIRTVAQIVTAVRHRTRPTLPLEIRHVLLVLVLLTAVMVQGWYNAERFGSPFTLRNQTSYFTPTTLSEIFELSRSSDLIQLYFGLSLKYFFSTFPYVMQFPATYSRPDMFFEWREPVISLSVSSPWLILSALTGLIAIGRNIRSWRTVLGLCLMGQSLLILSFPAATQRYASEFLPLLLFLAIDRVPFSTTLFIRLGAVLLITCAIAISSWSSVTWNALQNGDASRDVRSKLLQLALPLPRYVDEPGWIAGEGAPNEQMKSLVGVNAHHDKTPLSLSGHEFALGYGIHAPGQIALAIPEAASRFRVTVGLGDFMRWCDKASLAFAITQNGEEIFRSPMHRFYSLPEIIDVPLTSTEEIYLSTLDTGDSPDCDWGVWGEPQFFFPHAK